MNLEGLELTVVSGSPGGLEAGVRDVVTAIINGEGCNLGYLGVVIADDDLLRELNRKYGGVDHSTDVLAFDLDCKAQVVDGEVYISRETARRQARERGVSEEAEILGLLAHGLLHLCGYEHPDAGSLESMLALGGQYLGSVLGEESLGS